jgi:hypothetical protein
MQTSAHDRLLLRIVVTILSLAWAWALVPASASEDAHLRVIGFSEDGRYFAFEQYGLTAGSGSPFSSLYIVDLPANRWVAGTPVRRLLREGSFDDGTAYEALAALRAEVDAEAAPLLTRRSVRIPASVVFARGLGDHAAQTPLNAIRIPFTDSPLGERAFAQFDLLLEEIPARSQITYCVQPTKGYRLTLRHPDADPVVLHADTSVPRSRGCAQAYRLSQFLVPDAADCATAICPDGPLGVALISVFAEGFEGLGRRFIAVPVPFLRDPQD